MGADAAKRAGFFADAKRGDAQAVINAIARAPELLHAKDEVNKWTALHILARLSLTQPVQQLLSLGADPEARDAAFRSALHLAAMADASPTVAVGDTAAAAAAPPPPSRDKAIQATLRALLKKGARVTARARIPRITTAVYTKQRDDFTPNK